MLNGATRLYLILGDPVAQVKSPEHLTRILNARGANALVAPAHVHAADLPGVLAAARLMRNLDGLIATIPHKFALRDWCETASERAGFLGSANLALRRADGRWHADNLDGVGCLDGIARRGFTVEGRRALLVGAGGAGSAVGYEILARGAAGLVVHDTDAVRRDRLVARLAERFPGRASAGDADPCGADLVVNVTPCGMRAEDPLPVEAGGLAPHMFVADAITEPAETALLARARELGCATMGGVGMFEAQAELLVDAMLATR